MSALKTVGIKERPKTTRLPCQAPTGQGLVVNYNYCLKSQASVTTRFDKCFVSWSPWRNRLARSAVTSTWATERLVVQTHPGTILFFLF